MMSSETRTVPSRPQRSPRSSPTSHNPHIPEQPSWSAPNMATSTPVSTHSRKLSPRNSPTFGAHNSAEVTISPLPRISEMENPELLVPDNVSASSFTEFTDPIHEVVIPGRVAVPILGYEVMEERARFTVFKIQVRLGPSDTWYIFRRYSDFDILNMKLKELFPHFRLSLPPKKWFGDNYDKNFLEDRMLGLQAFLNNIVGHHEVCNSKPVKEFFCFEEPPGPHDSLEESRALCETLESRVFELHHQLAERDARTALLEEELRLSQVQVDNLRKALKAECCLYSGTLPTSQRLHADHVINLVLLDLLERSLSAGHRPSSQTLLHIPEETVVPPSGDCEKSSQASSAVSNVESSTESTNLTSSLAAMETIRLTTVSREEAKAATTKPKSVRPKTENPQISNSLPKTVSSASKNTESVVTSHSTSSSPALRQTGPAQLRTTGAKHELSVGDVVAASSSPTPRVEMPGAIRNETRSAGAHSVDIKTSKNLNMNCVSDDSKLALASGVNNNVKYVENVQQNGLESKNKVVNMKKGLIPETG